MRYQGLRYIPVLGRYKTARTPALYSANYALYPQLLEVSSQNILHVPHCQTACVKLHLSFQMSSIAPYHPNPKCQNISKLILSNRSFSSQCQLGQSLHAMYTPTKSIIRINHFSQLLLHQVPLGVIRRLSDLASIYQEEVHDTTCQMLGLFEKIFSVSGQFHFPTHLNLRGIYPHRTLLSSSISGHCTEVPRRIRPWSRANWQPISLPVRLKPLSSNQLR